MLLNVEKLLFLLAFSLIISKFNCEIFSAINELEKLFDDEEIIILQLKSFAKHVSNDYVNR